LKRSGTTLHNQQPDQHYAKEMCRAAWEEVFTPDTGWFSDTCFFEKVSLTKMHICIPSCYICRLGPNLFISIDWFPYMNCNSVKSTKLLHFYLPKKSRQVPGQRLSQGQLGKNTSKDLAHWLWAPSKETSP
jgi:hypothetical protein